MADTAARLAISARRNEVARFTIAVTGIDMTGVAMAMQIRLGRDVPGAPLISLATVTTLAAEGLKLDSVTTTNGVPTSIIKGRINASTMTDATKVPYMGEVGTDSVLAYAMQWTLGGDAQTRLYGDFIVVGSAFGSDGAPTNRPVSYGAPSSAVGGSSGGSLSFGDQVILVTIASADLVGIEVAKAVAASAAAVAARILAQTAATGASGSAAGAQASANTSKTYLDAVQAEVGRIQAGTQVSLQATSRTLLAGFPNPVNGQQAILSEFNHEGLFVARSKADDAALAAKAVADQAQVAFVQSTQDPDKVWVRDTRYGASPAFAGNSTAGGQPDANAFAATLALLAAVGVNNNNGVYKGSPPLLVPAGNFSMGTTTLVIPNTMRVQGAGTGLAGGVVSRMTWAVDTIGIRLERYNTSNGQISSPTHYGADGAIIEGLTLSGSYGGTASPGSHAISTNCRMLLRDCTMDNWGGDGLRVFGSAGGSPSQEGNSNSTAVERVRVTNCYNGISIGVGASADTNAGYTLGVDVSGNRAVGLLDSAFINFTHFAPHAAGNLLGDYVSTNINSVSLWVGPYAEGGYQVSKFAPLNLRIGGILAGGFSGGNHIYTNTVDDTSTTTIDPQFRVRNQTGIVSLYLDGSAQQRIIFRDNTATRKALVRQADSRLYFEVAAGSIFDWRIDAAQILTLKTTDLSPGTDNVLSLGSATKRYANVYAATGTINTSDRNHKTDVRRLDDPKFAALLDAVAAVPLVAFRFKDAVAEKGAAARDHYGIIAQDLAEALKARGLEPFAGGVLGRDHVMEEFEDEEEIERAVVEIEKYQQTVIEIIDGKAVQKLVDAEREMPVFDAILVQDEDGNQVIKPAVPERIRPQLDQHGNPLRDEEGNPLPDVIVPARPARPLTHNEPRKEKVMVPTIGVRPKIDADGNPVWLWSVRYDEFWALRMAALERAAV